MHFHLENAINAHDERVWVVLNKFVVLYEAFHQGVQFLLRHGFDDEFAVVTKEEEAA